MAKSKPIGVRFDDELLSKLKNANIVDSPQKALNLYEKSYIEYVELKIAYNELISNDENTSNLSHEKPKDNKTQAKEVKKENKATETTNSHTEKESMPVWNSKLEKYGEFVVRKNKWIENNK